MPKRADKVAAAPAATKPQGSTDDPPWLVPESELRESLIETSGYSDIPDEQEIAEGFDGPIGGGPQGPETAKKPAARKPRASRAAKTADPSADAGLSPVSREVPDEVAAAARNAIELVPLDDTTEYLSVMYYGVEGTGKTTDSLLMSTLPEPGIVVAVNAEGGMKKGALTAMGVDTSRIMAYPRPGERITFEGLERLFFQLSARLAADPGSVLGVVWDSVTDIVQEILDQRVESVVQTQQEIVARNKGARPGNIRLRDRFDNDRDDYRYMSNQVRSLLRKYRYLPCHFVVTALMRRDEDEVTKRVMYGPAVTPALQTDLLGYVDMVLNCQVAEIGDASVYFATTIPTRTTRGKDRLHVLPTPELVNPSFDRLVAYTRGELSADTDPEQKLLAAKPTPAQSGATAKPPRAASGKRAAKPTAPNPPPPVTGNPDDQPPY